MSHPFELFSYLRKRYYTQGLYYKTLLNTVLLGPLINNIKTSIMFLIATLTEASIIFFLDAAATLK